MKTINKLFLNRLSIYVLAIFFFGQPALGQTISGDDTDTVVLSKKTLPVWIRWVERLHMDVGVNYRQVSNIAGNYLFRYQPSGQTEVLSIEKDLKNQTVWFGINTTISYTLSKNWDISLHASDNNPFSKKNVSFSHADIGSRYRVNIKSKGNPLFLGGSLSIGWNDHYVYLGQLNHSLDKFNAGGTTIKSKKLDVYAGYKQTTLSPGISLSKKIGKIWYEELELYAKYHIGLSKRKVVELRERDGFFLCRKTATLPGNTVQITTDSAKDDPYITLAPFEIGLMVRFW